MADLVAIALDTFEEADRGLRELAHCRRSKKPAFSQPSPDRRAERH